VRLALEPHSEFEIVGETTSGSEVLPRVAELQPDVVLLDIRMPGLDGLQVLARLQEHHPEMKVVMLSGVEDAELAAEALRRGAKAFLGKGIDPADVAPVLRQVFEGEIVTETVGNSVGVEHRPADHKQIALEFWLSEQTIKYHLTNVYRKLGVSSRTEAARFAYDHGLAGGNWSSSNGTQHQSPSVG
jgi:two-component system nitrate/nitrite response regulator NarL